jgi:hypothetical protein
MNRRSQVNRGDLLLCLEHSAPALRPYAAVVCGFAPTTDAPLVPKKSIPRDPPPSPRGSEPLGEQTPAAQAAPAPDFAVLHAETAQGWETDPQPPLDLAVPFSESEMRSRRTALPPKPPLLRWARLWPYLRGALGHRFETGRLDDLELVRRMAASVPITRLPRRRKVGWAPRSAIWLDRSGALAPFWEDMDRLVARIRAWRPAGGLEVVDLSDGRPPDGWAFRTGSSQPPLLVLGDLGCFSGEPAKGETWSALGLQLRRQGVHLSALMPCPRDRWRSATARLWRCSSWDRGQRLRVDGTQPIVREPTDDRASRALRELLALIAPAVRCELGLLRCLRLAVPGADVGTEHDAWNHDEVERMGLAMVLPGPRALARAADIEPLSGKLKEAAAKWITRFHEGCGPTVRVREAINLARFRMRPGADSSPEALADQRRLASNLITLVRNRSPQELRASGLLEYLGREIERTSPDARPEERGLTEAFAAAVVGAGVSIARLPEGIDPEVVRKLTDLLQDRGREGWWEVRMVGPDLKLVLVPRSVAPRDVSGLNPGLRLAWLRSGTASFSVTTWSAEGPPKCFQIVAGDRDSVRLPIPTAKQVSVRSDRAEIGLGRRAWPRAAKQFGHDRFGQFARFEVGGVSFRLRWIPPGTFRMGSPEGEPGRYGNEGPQHWVTITQGYWLAETPCTQALWEAVMGNNPSHFKGSQRPVESVDCNQCRGFCERMSQEVPGLLFSPAHRSGVGVRLPGGDRDRVQRWVRLYRT